MKKASGKYQGSSHTISITSANRQSVMKKTNVTATPARGVSCHHGHGCIIETNLLVYKVSEVLEPAESPFPKVHLGMHFLNTTFAVHLPRFDQFGQIF